MPPATLLAVALVILTCSTETHFGQIASPFTHGFIELIDGHMKHSSKIVFMSHVEPTYRAVFNYTWPDLTSALTGCVSLDGWTAGLGTLILGITLHYIDDDWRLSPLPVAILNIGASAKTGEQLRCIVNEAFELSAIVGS